MRAAQILLFAWTALRPTEPTKASMKKKKKKKENSPQ